MKNVLYFFKKNLNFLHACLSFVFAEVFVMNLNTHELREKLTNWTVAFKKKYYVVVEFFFHVQQLFKQHLCA